MNTAERVWGDQTNYEVWEYRDGEPYRQPRRELTFRESSDAQDQADYWNQDESVNAHIEQRRIRREYRVVTARTIREF